MATATQQAIDELITNAGELKADYDALITERAANRTLLRNFAKSGQATAKQVESINALYPERTKKDNADAAATNGDAKK